MKIDNVGEIFLSLKTSVSQWEKAQIFKSLFRMGLYLGHDSEFIFLNSEGNLAELFHNNLSKVLF